MIITDDQIRESLEGAQLKLQRERGTDVTIFSPRASAMAHHIGTATTSAYPPVPSPRSSAVVFSSTRSPGSGRPVSAG